MWAITDNEEHCICLVMSQVTNRNSKVMPQVGHQDGSEDAGDVDPAPGDKPEPACILS